MRSAVIDVGTSLTKAGFSGEEAPREVFPSCVAELREHGARPTLHGHPADIVVGSEAATDSGLLDVRWPVVHGHVQSAAELEPLLYYALYRRLSVAPDVTPCLLLEPADQPREAREAAVELLFETFNAPMVGLLNTASATVYSTGRTTGVAVDSGAGKTMIAAVRDGYTLAHSMRPSTIAGNALTDDLFSFLRSRGYPLSVRRDWELVNHIKSTLCRADASGRAGASAAAPPRGRAAAAAAAEESGGQYPGKADGTAVFELPDNERIFLLEAETGLAERLFDPAAALPGAGEHYTPPPTPTGYTTTNPTAFKDSYQRQGWADTICDVVAACPSTALRAELMGAVVLGGGTTMLRDVELRLQRDLTARQAEVLGPDSPHDALAKVAAFPQRAQAAWVGGSVWSSSTTFPSTCLTKANYYEGGPSCVHRHAM